MLRVDFMYIPLKILRGLCNASTIYEMLQPLAEESAFEFFFEIHPCPKCCVLDHVVTTRGFCVGDGYMWITPKRP